MTCPPIETLVRFRKQRLEGEERESIEQHLASCESCRRALVDGYLEDKAPAIEPLPTELRSRVAALVGPPSWTKHRGLLSAAAVLLVAIGITLVSRNAPQETVWRDLEAVSQGIEVLEPDHRASFSSSTLFRWKSVSKAEAYRLVIFTEVGERIFEWTGTETQARIVVGDLNLDDIDGTSRWRLSFFVEAELENGRRIASTPQTLFLNPDPTTTAGP